MSIEILPDYNVRRTIILSGKELLDEKLSIYCFISSNDLLMGSSFAIVKLGLPYASPLLLVRLRFILAGIIMAIVVIILKRPHPITRSEWFKLCMIGLFQTAGVMGCIF